MVCQEASTSWRTLFFMAKAVCFIRPDATGKRGLRTPRITSFLKF